MFLKLHSLKKLCNFSILKNWLEIDKYLSLQVYLLATTTESAVWVSPRTAWQCVPDLGTASSRSGIEEVKTTSKNPSYKIKIIILTTKPQSKLLKALEDKETERQDHKKKWFPIFFLKFYFWPSWVSLFQCSRSVIRWVLLLQKKKAKKLDLLS